MSRIARGAAGLGAAVTVLMLAESSPACAGGTFRPRPDDSNASTGIPGSFVFLIVVGILISIAIGGWKVMTAQRLAKQSGMDPGLATQMTLLSDDGLDATYLAASLRRPPEPPIGDTSAIASAATEVAAPPPPPLSTAERLTELKSLLDQGLVTPSEYDDRRKAIIDQV